MSHQSLIQTKKAWILVVFLLTSCQASPPMTATPISSSQEYKTVESSNRTRATPTMGETQMALPPTATSTRTPLPTNTLTPSPSFAPTSTETPTITPSPTPDRVLAGFYPVGQCVTTSMPYNSKLDFCVLSVTVSRERHMTFMVSWTLSGIPEGMSVTKRSDQNNRNMYLIDNMGKRYDHIGGGGAAYSELRVKNGETDTGWFEFASPPPGAFSFSFYDDDNQIVIKGIGLYNVVVLYEELSLSNSPLVVEYRKDLWELAEKEGQQVLKHKKIDGCTLEERPSGTPQGKFKNKIEIGKLIYEIYGYIEQGKNVGIREYILVGGVEGLEATIKPFFLVSIPLDKSESCLFDASDLLAKVSMK